MSTTLKRLTLSQAIEEAEAFKALFNPAFYGRWEFAGSIRRGKADIGGSAIPIKA